MAINRCLVVAFLVAGMGSGMLFAAGEPVKPLSQWNGSVAAEDLEKIAPEVITTGEGWGILWKAWKAGGEVPDIDFDHTLVIVSTTRGSRLNLNLMLDEQGDLKAVGLATRDLRPGFRYVLSAVPREGVLSVNGNAVAARPDLGETLIFPTGIPYQPEQVVSGTIHLGGSMTMSQMMHEWAKDFEKFHPDMKFEIDSEGSETSLPKLKADDLAIMGVSRPVSPAEIAAWEKTLGRKLMVFPVFEDDIAVIVHPDNPVKQLSAEQLKMIYAPGNDPLTWGKLGLMGEWADKPVTLHGRNEKSGTRHYLRSLAVGEQGAERPAKEYGSYHEIVEAVAADPGAIGYSRAANVRKEVKPVPIGPLAKGEVRPYLRRACQLVVVVPDTQTLPPAVQEFLLFVYRLDGQSQLFRDGFTPLGKEVIGQQLERLGVRDLK